MMATYPASTRMVLMGFATLAIVSLIATPALAQDTKQIPLNYPGGAQPIVAANSTSILEDSSDLGLDEWIEVQQEISWSRLLGNVAPDGADRGCVVASPSTHEPDYWYQWTRDSALVFKPIIDSYITTSSPTSLSLILDYIAETEKMQHEQTLVGGFADGGLGEVKYHVNGTSYKGNWGRPQNDGPALRSIDLITFTNAYLDKHQGNPAAERFVQTKLYDSKLPTHSIIKADLEYTARNFGTPSFDLWEEVNAMHFFTLLVSHRSLVLGASLADRLSDPGASAYYLSQSKKISSLLDRFWNVEKGYVFASLNWTDDHGKTSWKDVGTLLGVLHGLGKGVDDDGNYEEWGTRSEKMLATHKAVIDSMREVYPLNAKYVPGGAVAVGRYPEDVYDGVGMSIANPWYLTTLASAEFLYRLITPYPNSSSETITLSEIALPFFSQFNATPLSIGDRVKVGDGGELDQGIRAFADGFVEIVREWKWANGSLNEQFDRVSGTPRGARELTWSHAAFVSMAGARAGRPIVF